MPTRIVFVTLTAATLLAGPPGHAQPKPADPDWPCQQLLVPKLSAGSYWAGTTEPKADPDWRDSDSTTHLIETIVSRDTSDAKAVALATATVRHATPGRRATTAAELFGDVVEEANAERDEIISHIDQLSRRQQNLGQTIDRINGQIAKTPTTSPDYADLVGQRDFNIQTFQDAQHTIRYACDAPASYDRRLGLIARALQQK
jgi:hypothetical protein